MTTILTYHHVAPTQGDAKKGNLYVTPEEFRRQLLSLKKRGFRSVTLDELRDSLMGKIELPPRTVAITFDDGYTDNFEHAFPILKEVEMTATFFVVTGRIGAEHEGEHYMHAWQLRQMRDEGMTIGSHTVNHPWLARLSLDEARHELMHSRKTLEDMLGGRVKWLAYPSGSFSRDVAQIALECGYLGACSVIRDNRCTVQQMYYLPRVMVMPGVSKMRFRYYFGGLYHWIHDRKNRKRWKKYKM